MPMSFLDGVGIFFKVYFTGKQSTALLLTVFLQNK